MSSSTLEDDGLKLLLAAMTAVPQADCLPPLLEQQPRGNRQVMVQV
ncbi:MAG: hypothetical protein AAF827_23510 [Cyanobacteria bacterium P01_D01_bin.6]